MDRNLRAMRSGRLGLVVSDAREALWSSELGRGGLVGGLIRRVALACAVAVAPSGVAAAAVTCPAPSFTEPSPPTSAQCVALTGVQCYSPAQMQQAYGLKPLYRKGYNGSGRTIIIVDPYGSPTIGNDLTVFDEKTGLPAPPHFRVIAPEGPIPPFPVLDLKHLTSYDRVRLDKAGETTGDVELAHEIAPRANILLVETPVTETRKGGGFAAMMAAEQYVFEHNMGDVVSQSFSLPEQNFGRAAIMRLRYPYLTARRDGVSVFGATNDTGVTGPPATGSTLYTHRVVQWPASDPLVTGVGGTDIHLDAAGNRISPDTAWNDTWNPFVSDLQGNCAAPPMPWSGSGGLSSVFTRPAYQDAVRNIVHGSRGLPDISMNAAIGDGVLTYSSYFGFGLWAEGGGGTSAATPEFAAIIAIADQLAHKRLGLINPYLYELERRHAPGIVDITKGTNTISFHENQNTNTGPIITVKGYNARRGYNLVTGLGTPNARLLVPELVKLARQTTKHGDHKAPSFAR
jgi:subtilase family serine protease